MSSTLYGSSANSSSASSLLTSRRSKGAAADSSLSTSRRQPGQIVLAHRLRELEVVVEAVLDRRADGHLGAGEESGRRLGQHVRRRVTQHVQTLRGTWP